MLSKSTRGCVHVRPEDRYELTSGRVNGRGGGQPGREVEHVGSGPALAQIHCVTSGKSQTLSGPRCSLCTVDDLIALRTWPFRVPLCVCVCACVHACVLRARARGTEEGPGACRACLLHGVPPSAHCVLHIPLQVPVGAACVGESPAVNFENSYFCRWQRRPVRTRQLVDEQDGRGGVGRGGVGAVQWRGVGYELQSCTPTAEAT